SEYARQVGVPLYFVGIGDAHDVRDLYLHDLQADDSVFVNDRIIFKLKVTAQGYRNLPVTATLREKGKEKVLDKVSIEAGAKPTEVTLKHIPDTPGEKNYEIEVPVQADEVDRDNNRLERQVYVREAKLIRVLYVEGYRRYEFQYLKTLLERESN